MTRLGGYVGRFLKVDLTHSRLEEEQPPEALLRAFIGGYGVGARVLYDLVPAGADPLGPDNALGFVTGPLTGTPALLASRFCVVGKSPLTGGWGDANSGGQFGPALKFAGYDAVFVTGKAPAPVYLWIDDGRAELRPADGLWGLDSYETEDTLQDRHGQDVRVACIGPAGERRSLIAAVINDRTRAAARSGLGAVMGAKGLKAVAVRGNLAPPLADEAAVKALRKKYLPLFRTGGAAEVLAKHGTPGFTKALTAMGRTPIKNWRGFYPDDYPNADKVDGPAFDGYETKRYACWHCNQACGADVRWEWGGETRLSPRPEYETLASMGTYCGIEDVETIMRLNDLCNRAGLDTISAGAAIAFAMECYEQGLLDEQQLAGLELAWGAGEAAVTLLERMVARQGLGEVLADGVRRASEILGPESEPLAIHAGGQELPAHDPRHEAGFGLAYQISPTPGRHTQGGVGTADAGPEEKAFYGLDPEPDDPASADYQARAYAAGTAWKNVVNAAGLCTFGQMTVGDDSVAEFLSAVTGWDAEPAEYQEAGERIEVMRHVFGLREGYRPLQVEVAPRAMGRPPLPGGPRAGVTVDVAAIRAAYLDLMEWDSATAVPSRARMEALGLGEVMASLADVLAEME